MRRQKSFTLYRMKLCSLISYCSTAAQLVNVYTVRPVEMREVVYHLLCIRSHIWKYFYIHFVTFFEPLDAAWHKITNWSIIFIFKKWSQVLCITVIFISRNHFFIWGDRFKNVLSKLVKIIAVLDRNTLLIMETIELSICADSW